MLHFTNTDVWTIRYYAHLQQRTALLQALYVRNAKPDRCILYFQICITMEQQFIFPITHSIHTLDRINILSDYRFSFCFATLWKIDHNTRVWTSPHFLLRRVETPTKFSKSENSAGLQFSTKNSINRGDCL